MHLTTLALLLCLLLFTICLSQCKTEDDSGGDKHEDKPRGDKHGKDKSHGGGKGKTPKEKANNKPHGVRKGHKKLPAEALNIIIEKCHGGKCKQQTQRGKSRRAAVRDIRLQKLKLKPFEDLAPEEVEEKVERTLNKVQLLKKALYRIHGLPSDIEPEDNGLFGGDQILGESEVDFMLTKTLRFDAPELLGDPEFSSFVPLPESVLPEVANLSEDQDIPVPDPIRSRRSAFFFDSPQVQAQKLKWTMPVSFFISNIPDAQAAFVRQALADISTATTNCVSFKEAKTRPTSSQVPFTIVFQSFTEKTLCGMSTTGRRSTNNIYLNFGCTNVKGRAIHEILHTLGVAHHHNRLDRDCHIQIQWDSVDPQAFDFYTTDDPDYFSSFGTSYDHRSVMHYDAYAGASVVDRSDPSKAAMVPLDSGISLSDLGQRRQISCGDVELLKKMYCCSSGCVDQKALCGLYANNGSCDSDESWFWMQQNCGKSCQICCPSQCSSECSDFCANPNFCA